MTRNTQEKLQNILKSQDYSIRYERGNFQGGYCVVQDQKIIVINIFHPLEGKINTLVEIIRDLEIDETLLSPDQQKWVTVRQRLDYATNIQLGLSFDDHWLFLGRLLRMPFFKLVHPFVQLLGQLGIQRMSRTNSDDVSFDRLAQQEDIADHIQNLVTHQLVFET